MPDSATVTLHATSSHSASASSQEAGQHAPNLSASGSSRGAPGAKFNSVVKLGASGVRTFHGAASASPSMSPLHIRLPRASPAPPPPGPPSSHVAIAFGSSLRRTLKSPSPASSLPSPHSLQRSAAERPITIFNSTSAVRLHRQHHGAHYRQRVAHGKASRAD